MPYGGPTMTTIQRTLASAVMVALGIALAPAAA